MCSSWIVTHKLGSSTSKRKALVISHLTRKVDPSPCSFFVLLIVVSKTIPVIDLRGYGRDSFPAMRMASNGLATDEKPSPSPHQAQFSLPMHKFLRHSSIETVICYPSSPTPANVLPLSQRSLPAAATSASLDCALCATSRRCRYLMNNDVAIMPTAITIIVG